MDDRNTHNLLDALADLFLTPGTSGTPGTPGTPGSAGAASESRTSNADQTLLDGPAPMRLAPKVVLRTPPAPPSAKPPSATLHSASSSAVIATIRPQRIPPTLGSVPGSAPGRSVSANAPGHASSPTESRVPKSVVSSNVPSAVTPANVSRSHLTAPEAFMPVGMEAVVLGSLPGFAGPWLTQYAHYLAQTVGPVLLVHLDAQTISLEMVQPASARPDLSEETAPGHSAQHREPFTSPVQAIDQLAQTEGSIHHVLLHVDEPARLLELTCPKLTLLCGAYDAAIVDAVQRLRTIHDLAAQGAGLRMHVGLMVMGSDAERAQAAVKKLASATSFLPTPVQLIGARKQMVPVQVQRLADFPATAEHWADLKAYFEELANYEPPAFADIVPSAEATPESPEPPESPEMAPESSATPQVVPSSDPPAPAEVRVKMAVVPTRAVRSTPPGNTPGNIPGSVSGNTPGSASGNISGNVPENAPGHASSMPESSPVDPLALVAARIPGSIVLEARIPQQKEVRLLLDQDGCVHLLHRAVEDHALAPAVVDLIQARQWVRTHLDLLALTQRQCRFAPQAEPVLHLATTNAQLAPALARRLGDYLRIHLLQQVPPSAQPTWLCVEV